MKYHLFDVCGVEIEYMVVRRRDLEIFPRADIVLRDEKGEPCDEIACGRLTRCNELVRHVIELKVSEPVKDLRGIEGIFAEEVRRINEELAAEDAFLVPGPTHPWMDPRTQTELWPFANREWYETFHRIFDCHRHGWANLQSMHLNFPFTGDAEFRTLHAAIRVLLPIIPALAAASPYLDGTHHGRLCERMEVYRHNAVRVPSIAGEVIPEAVFNGADYQSVILDPIFRDIAPYDPDEILREPWLNSRGAIARFDRGTIEIRIIDSQEHPGADFALAWAIWNTLKALCSQQLSSTDDQAGAEQAQLVELFVANVATAEQTELPASYLKLFGWQDEPCTAGMLWNHLIKTQVPAHAAYQPVYDRYVADGPLARRMLKAFGPAPDHAALSALVEQLGRCLNEGTLFYA